MHEQGPQKVRVSIGSAVVLGLLKSRLDAKPTTVYLLTHGTGKCRARCAFCPQSHLSKGRADMLSRVVWPTFPTKDVISRVAVAFGEGGTRRVCVQALDYPNVQEDIIHLARRIHSSCEIPISVSCQPLLREDLLSLVNIGVDRVSIALDAVTEDLFNRVKGPMIGGPYTWERHFDALREAVELFGRNRVTTHLIAGLGEKEEDIVAMMQRCVNLGVYPALFAFTPIQGTILADRPSPPLHYYSTLLDNSQVSALRRHEVQGWPPCGLRGIKRGTTADREDRRALQNIRMPRLQQTFL
jgi:biotin synthase-related radical SAM superfamily protein